MSGWYCRARAEVDSRLLPSKQHVESLSIWHWKTAGCTNQAPCPIRSCESALAPTKTVSLISLNSNRACEKVPETIDGVRLYVEAFETNDIISPLTVANSTGFSSEPCSVVAGSLNLIRPSASCLRDWRDIRSGFLINPGRCFDSRALYNTSRQSSKRVPSNKSSKWWISAAKDAVSCHRPFLLKQDKSSKWWIFFRIRRLFAFRTVYCSKCGPPMPIFHTATLHSKFPQNSIQNVP
jgi:hypothetical protein